MNIDFFKDEFNTAKWVFPLAVIVCVVVVAQARGDGRARRWAAGVPGCWGCQEAGRLGC